MVSCVTPVAVASQSVRGLVVDATTEAPIHLATVSLISERGEETHSVLANEEGFFSIEWSEDGLFLVRGIAPGYRAERQGPFEFEPGEVRIVELRLAPAPVAVEGLLVEGQRGLADTGFWERYEEGRGQFLTPSDVLASEAVFTPQLLRGLDHVIETYERAPWQIWPQLRRANGLDRGPCSPRVFVDDVWMNRPAFGPVETGLGLDDVVPRDRVRAVELYWGPFQAPLKYQGTIHDNDCGVVLIWTNGSS